jgi:hypothetical protein
MVPHRGRSVRRGSRLYQPKRYIAIVPYVNSPGCRQTYTGDMAGVILLLVLGLGAGVLIVWGSSLPRTRPRPDSRYRGRTFMEVDRKVKRTKPRD